MRVQMRDFLIKPLLALAIAIPAMMAGNVSSAEASHKHRRGAIIAGAVIGGVIAYKHYKRKKHHRKHYGHGYKSRGYGYGYKRRGYGYGYKRRGYGYGYKRRGYGYGGYKRRGYGYRSYKGSGIK